MIYITYKEIFGIKLKYLYLHLSFFIKHIKKKIFYKHKIDQKKHIIHLIFSYFSLIKLFYSHFNIFLLDCIYNLNQFKMFLLHIIGVIGINIIL